MNTYNEIFQNILSNVHHHYREHKKDTDETIKEKQLREIYKPILNCPVLKNNIVWFNAWKRMHTGKPEVYFIKKCRDIPKRILRVYREKTKEYNQYVASLSSLAKDYNIGNKDDKQRSLLDYACLITEKKHHEYDNEMNSKYVRDLFVYLNFEELTKLFKDIDFSKHYRSISKAFDKSEENGNEKIIELLKENYDWLSKKTRRIDVIVSALTDQLSSSWQCSSKFGDDLNVLIKKKRILDSNQNYLKKEKHKENIIKLINYYFWVKLAFQKKEWKVLLYLPGVIAKEFEGIPLGVNIGLKEMVPLEIILFLKNAVLLFFTRESVDFFQKKAENEAAKRISDVKKAKHEIIEYPHIVGDYGIKTIKAANKFHKGEIVKLVCDEMAEKTTYLSIIAEEREVRLFEVDLYNLIINFQKTCLLITKFVEISESEETFDKAVEIWKSIFPPPHVGLNKFSISASKPLIYNILENLALNTLKHFTSKCPLVLDDYNNVKTTINLDQTDTHIIMEYSDNGIGFKQEILDKIPCWLKGEFTEEERNKRKGFGFYSMGKTVKLMEGSSFQFQSTPLGSGQFKGIFKFFFPKKENHYE